MKRTLISIIVMTGIAAGLLAYLLYGENPKPPPSDDEWKPTFVIPRNIGLKSITIDRPGQKLVIQYRKDLQNWVITEPIETYPDLTFFKMFSSDLLQVKKEKLIERNPPDLGRYQLDPPAARIIVGFQDDRPELVLNFGKVNYNQDHFYAKLDGEDLVFLVPYDLHQFLDASVEQFRSRALLYNNPMNIASVEIVITDPQLRAENPTALEPKLVVQSQEKDRPEWMIISPVREPADFEFVKGLMFRLANTGAPEVLDVPESQWKNYGLDPPRGRVTFSLVDGTKEEILLGNQDPKDPNRFYTRNSLRTEIIVVDELLYRTIVNAHFRSQYLVDNARQMRLDKVVIQFPRQPDKNFILLKDKAEGLYYFEDQPDQKSLITLIRPFFKNLRNPVNIIAHKEPVPRKELGLETPSFRITLSEDNDVIMDVSLGDTIAQEEEVYTYGEDHLRHFAFIVAGDALSGIPPAREFITAKPKEIEAFLKRQERWDEQDRNQP